jgi:hypothetical protein
LAYELENKQESTVSTTVKKIRDRTNLHEFVGRAFPTNIHEIGDP